MKDYVICIDASVDIDQQFIEDNKIVIIPMKYILGDTEYLMENRLTDSQLLDFYNAMRAGEMTQILRAGKLVALGEICIADDTFAIRVVEVKG